MTKEQYQNLLAFLQDKGNNLTIYAGYSTDSDEVVLRFCEIPVNFQLETIQKLEYYRINIPLIGEN